jgi:hypothetical protein
MAYAPADRPVIAVSVEGTEWSMNGEGPDRWNITYRFERGGVLSYGYNGANYRNGTWRQTGDEIYFEVNQKYRECRLTLRGDRLEGESWNKAGRRWMTDLSPSTGAK